MACKCIDKWEADVVAKVEVDGCPVKEATIEGVNLCTNQTISRIELRYQKGEKMRTKKMVLFHKFCPFCGKASEKRKGTKA